MKGGKLGKKMRKKLIPNQKKKTTNKKKNLQKHKDGVRRIQYE
jgi:hypothetical protein